MLSDVDVAANPARPVERFPLALGASPHLFDMEIERVFRLGAIGRRPLPSGCSPFCWHDALSIKGSKRGFVGGASCVAGKL